MISIKTIWENQLPTSDIIVKSKINGLDHLDCYAGTNQITGQHLFIMSISDVKLLPELKKFKFKGVEFFTIETGTSFEFNVYLLENDLIDIFIFFIDNIIEELHETISEKEAVQTILNVIFKWKKLFDKISFVGLSDEQQKGLIGELLFINFLIENDISVPTIIDAWTGANFEDKDFRFGSKGIEVKFSSAKLPKLKISSERQLDTDTLTNLYLLLYTTQEVKDNGFTLNSLIDQIRAKLGSNPEILQIFNMQLFSIGYLANDIGYYNKMYSLTNTSLYEITEQFPRITIKSLSSGIYNVSYSIELSAVEKYKMNYLDILKEI